MMIKRIFAECVHKVTIALQSCDILFAKSDLFESSWHNIFKFEEKTVQ